MKKTLAALFVLAFVSQAQAAVVDIGTLGNGPSSLSVLVQFDTPFFGSDYVFHRAENSTGGRTIFGLANPTNIRQIELTFDDGRHLLTNLATPFVFFPPTEHFSLLAEEKRVGPATFRINAFVTPIPGALMLAMSGLGALAGLAVMRHRRAA